METPTKQAERIIRLGEVIAREGVGAASVELLLLAHDARDAGVEPVLVDVMIDETIPSVVRERAFALVGSRLVYRELTSSVGDLTATRGALSSRVVAAH